MSQSLERPDPTAPAAIAARPEPVHPLTRVNVRCSAAWLARVQDLADTAHLDVATLVEQAVYRMAEHLGDNRPWPDRTGKVRPGGLAHPLDTDHRRLEHQLHRPDPAAAPLDASGRFHREPPA